MIKTEKVTQKTQPVALSFALTVAEYFAGIGLVRLGFRVGGLVCAVRQRYFAAQVSNVQCGIS